MAVATRKSVRFDIPLHSSKIFELNEVEQAVQTVKTSENHSVMFLCALRTVRDYSRPNAFNRDVETRKKVAEMICTGKFHILVASAIDFWRENDLEESTHKDHYDVLRQLNTIIWNNTDLSAQLCELVSDVRVLQSFVKYLDYSIVTKEGEISLKTPYIVKGILAILHNCLQKLDIGESLRALGAIPVLNQIQQCSYISPKCSAEIVLSYLLTEEETSQTETSEKIIKHMAKILRSAVAGDKHYSKSFGMRAAEVMQSLNRLASSDANKQTIGKHGIVELYVELLDAESSNATELHLAARGIWVFAFKLKEQIVNEPNALERLKKLTLHDDGDVRRATAGALWVLQGEEVASASQETEQKQLNDEGTCTDKFLTAYNWSISYE